VRDFDCLRCSTRIIYEGGNDVRTEWTSETLWNYKRYTPTIREQPLAENYNVLMLGRSGGHGFGTQSRNDAVRGGILVGSYGRDRSEIFGNNEEAAQGPVPSCRATRRAKGTDPRRLWIPEEVGCHLQQ
jgi:hypothetical protein